MEAWGILTLISVFVVGLWLLAMLALVLFSFISGRIPLAGLLAEPRTQKPAPLTRPQLLLTSFGAAGAYLSIALGNLGSARDLPDAPLWIVAALAGGHSIFHGGTAVSALLSRLLGRR